MPRAGRGCQLTGRECRCSGVSRGVGSNGAIWAPRGSMEHQGVHHGCKGCQGALEAGREGRCSGASIGIGGIRGIGGS